MSASMRLSRSSCTVAADGAVVLFALPMRLCRRASPLLALVLSGAVLAEPAGEQPRDTGEARDAAVLAEGPLAPRAVRRAREIFGVEVQGMALARSDAHARELEEHLEAALVEMERIARLVDPAREDSEVSRLNQAAGREPVVVSEELFSLLREAKRVAELSGGAFDPTLAPLAAVWELTRSEDGQAPARPSDEELAARRALVGHRELVLDAARRTAALAREGQAVVLEGIAKGYALERAAASLDERGVKDFLLSAGGDVVVRGSHGERPWRVGIQDPRARGHFAATSITGGAVMTTGDYERFFIDKGTRFHHVLDPRSGQPARGARSVTVFAADGATADALSRAVFVLGPKRGLALVQRLKGVEAVVVTDENKVLVSKGLEKDLRWRPPTDAP